MWLPVDEPGYARAGAYGMASWSAGVEIVVAQGRSFRCVCCYHWRTLTYSWDSRTLDVTPSAYWPARNQSMSQADDEAPGDPRSMPGESGHRAPNPSGAFDRIVFDTPEVRTGCVI